VVSKAFYCVGISIGSIISAGISVSILLDYGFSVTLTKSAVSLAESIGSCRDSKGYFSESGASF
jgi:hypothetical protein